jgi:hypothetical protein
MNGSSKLHSRFLKETMELLLLELVVGKLCFVLNFFIYSFNFCSPFTIFPLYFTNSHFPLYLSILSYDHRQNEQETNSLMAQNLLSRRIVYSIYYKVL